VQIAHQPRREHVVRNAGAGNDGGSCYWVTFPTDSKTVEYFI